AAELAVDEAPPVQIAASSSRVPRPIATTAVSPSVAAARAAAAAASRATGTENPAQAGADYARGPETAAASPRPAPRGPPAAAARGTPALVQTAARANGPWRVQLGAFSVPGNAEKLWSRLRSRAELAGRERLLVPSGRVTK